MTPAQAAKILNVSLEGLTPETVRAAFVAAAKTAHPDTMGGAPFEDVGMATERPDNQAHGQPSLSEVKAARDVLIKRAEQSAKLEDCPRCGGSGREKTRRGVTVGCSTCAGDGVVRKKEFHRG